MSLIENADTFSETVPSVMNNYVISPSVSTMSFPSKLTRIEIDAPKSCAGVLDEIEDDLTKPEESIRDLYDNHLEKNSFGNGSKLVDLVDLENHEHICDPTNKSDGVASTRNSVDDESMENNDLNCVSDNCEHADIDSECQVLMDTSVVSQFVDTFMDTSKDVQVLKHGASESLSIINEKAKKDLENDVSLVDPLETEFVKEVVLLNDDFSESISIIGEKINKDQLDDDPLKTAEIVSFSDIPKEVVLLKDDSSESISIIGEKVNKDISLVDPLETGVVTISEAAKDLLLLKDITSQSSISIIGEKRKKDRTDVTELVTISDDTSSESSSDGDYSRYPGQDAFTPIEPQYLLPFKYGWRRECTFRRSKEGAKTIDIYYIPPVDSPFRTREAKRKRRSKADQVKYFDDFSHSELTVANFNYSAKVLGLNNKAYEIIRKNYIKCDESANQPQIVGENKKRSNKNLCSEIIAHNVSDNDCTMVGSFESNVSIVLQANTKLNGLRSEFIKRRKYRDPETACTPPLAEDMLWSACCDDPLGVFNVLGGRSSPRTPPPLRGVNLTYKETAALIIAALKKIKDDAPEINLLDEGPKLQENLASHDLAIKKFRQYPIHERRLFSSGFPSRYPPHYRESTSLSLKRDFNVHSMSKNSMMHARLDRSFISPKLCSVHCPGVGKSVPNLQCFSCHSMFHQRCQGVSQHVTRFKCVGCVRKSSALDVSSRAIASSSSSNCIKMRLPMPVTNNKRSLVELVMYANNKYQPIKFSNNMHVVETILKSQFEMANRLGKTVYQKATQVPKVGPNRIFLAINPSRSVQSSSAIRPSGCLLSGSTVNKPHTAAVNSRTSHSNRVTSQVAILVRPTTKDSSPVLLNVPRSIALKVKPGTTLSFSASNGQKYTVLNNKMLAPLESTSSTRPVPTPVQSSNQSVKPSVSNTTSKRRPQIAPTSKVESTLQKTSRSLRVSDGNLLLPSGELLMNSSMSSSPCTPYCPGVTGLPEVECFSCKSLFHSHCIGLKYSLAIKSIKSTFKCGMCRQGNSFQSSISSSASSSLRSPQLILLD